MANGPVPHPEPPRAGAPAAPPSGSGHLLGVALVTLVVLTVAGVLYGQHRRQVARMERETKALAAAFDQRVAEAGRELLVAHGGELWQQAREACVRAETFSGKREFAEAKAAFEDAIRKLDAGIPAAREREAEARRLAEIARQEQARQEREQRIGEALTSAKKALTEERWADLETDIRRVLAEEPGRQEALLLQEKAYRQKEQREAAVQLQTSATTAHGLVQKFSAEDGFGPLQKGLEEQFASAERLFQQQTYDQAARRYQSVLEEEARLTRLDEERRAAVTSREQAEAARKKADEAGATANAQALWNRAEEYAGTAQVAAAGMKFGEARVAWTGAGAAYVQAETAAVTEQGRRAQQKACEEAATACTAAVERIGRPRLEAQGAEPWKLAQQAMTEGQRLGQAGDFAKAVEQYRAAQAALQEAERVTAAGERTAQYRTCLQQGDEAARRQDWAAAAKAYQAALQVPSFENDPAAKKGLTEAGREKALALARAARDRRDWAALSAAATEALTADPGAREAKELLAAAQPRLAVVAVVDGNEMPGAEVTLNGVKQPAPTPATFPLELGKPCRVVLTMPPVRARCYPGETALTVDRLGPYELRVELRRVLPPFLVEAAPDPAAPPALCVGVPAPLAKLAEGSPAAQQAQQQALTQTQLPLEVKTAKAGVVFRLLPAGSFAMGSPTTEADRAKDELPHQTALSQPFYCGKFEVTRQQWQAVMGALPPGTPNDHPEFPIEQVSWDDCRTFCQRLAELEKAPAGTFRLLTEAEWEFACRAGTASAYAFGNALPSALANFDGSTLFGGATKEQYLKKVAPVGTYLPNAFGLFDLHGNVWEWCQDWHAPYPAGAVTDPAGPPQGRARVLRGGSWLGNAALCRSAARDSRAPNVRSAGVGFRLAISSSAAVQPPPAPPAP